MNRWRGHPGPEVLAAFQRGDRPPPRRPAGPDPATAWDEQTLTPVGPGTYGLFMEIRVFDCWVHEQDVRRAVGRPGPPRRARRRAGRCPAHRIARLRRRQAGRRRRRRVGRRGAGPAAGPDPRRRPSPAGGPRPSSRTADPTVRIRTDGETWACLCAGRWSAGDVVAARPGRVRRRRRARARRARAADDHAVVAAPRCRGAGPDRHAWELAPRAAARSLVGGEIVDDRGDVDAPLPWASVTKLATAVAALRRRRDGRRSASTTRPGRPDRRCATCSPTPPASTFDAPVVRAAPGSRRIYSNAGYEVLADDGGAAPWASPSSGGCAAAVLEPLGMTTDPVGGFARVGPGRAARRPGRAGRANSNGRGCCPTRPGRHAARWRSPGWPGLLPGLGYQAPNDWGLGPEIRDAKSPHWTGQANAPATFGHFGAAGGFVWVDPVAGVACACLTGTAVRAVGPDGVAGAGRRRARRRSR